MDTYFSRRDFLKVSALGAVSALPLVGLSSQLVGNQVASNEELKVYIFSKHLQFLDYKGMSEAAKEMGFDGVDLTVRPKGHVLPDRVGDDLPKATEAMKAFDLQCNMIATSVKDASNNVDRKVLETASELGYEYYRTAWYKYKTDQDIIKALEKYTLQLESLAKLNETLGISGSYHNHSGFYMGASIWDLYGILKDVSPKYLGCQYDISHASIEGGKNWEIGLRLIQDSINTLVVKDFKWAKVNGQWKPVFTPLGEGMVDLKYYFGLLKELNINVPLSIHVEYDLGGAEHGGKPSIDQKEVFARIKHDLDFVKKMWKEA